MEQELRPLAAVAGLRIISHGLRTSMIRMVDCRGMRQDEEEEEVEGISGGVVLILIIMMMWRRLSRGMGRGSSMIRFLLGAGGQDSSVLSRLDPLVLRYMSFIDIGVCMYGSR